MDYGDNDAVVTFLTRDHGRVGAFVRGQVQEVAGQLELYTVRPDGSDVTKINGPLAMGGRLFDGISWAPDSSRIAYRAEETTVGVFELHTASPDGVTNDTINPAGSAGGIAWAPDSSRIAFRATLAAIELFSALPDGSGHVQLNPPVVAGGRIDGFAWSPDSSLISYRGDQDVDGETNLYVVQPDGTGPQRVSSGDSAFGYTWSPDSTRLAYWGIIDANPGFDIAVVASDGTGDTVVSGAMVVGGNVSGTFEFSGDSNLVVYIADQETDEQDELFVSTVDGTTNTKISRPLQAEGEVIGFVLRP